MGIKDFSEALLPTQALPRKQNTVLLFLNVPPLSGLCSAILGLFQADSGAEGKGKAHLWDQPTGSSAPLSLPEAPLHPGSHLFL